MMLTLMTLYCNYLTRPHDWISGGRLSVRALVALVPSCLLAPDMNREPYPTVKSMDVSDAAYQVPDPAADKLGCCENTRYRKRL